MTDLHRAATALGFVAIAACTHTPDASDGGAADLGGVMRDGSAPADDGRVPDSSAHCASPSDCQDGVFCNGYEACAPGTAGADARGCVAGTPPCTGACDETALRCTPARCETLPPLCTSDADCSDHSTCDGAETCDADGVCQPGTPSCTSRLHCLYPADACGCSVDADCDDGAFCNGAERCTAGTCVAGTSPCGTRTCSETDDMCDCTSSADCDDGLYCDGVDYCEPSTSRCAVLPITCPLGQICLEGRNRCATGCTANSDCDDGIASDGAEYCSVSVCYRGPVDADGDYSASIASGGDDCDDTNPSVNPRQVEICDTANVDEDCDPTTFGDRDSDHDGHPDGSCCNLRGTALACGDDCDDSRPSTHPTALDVCNGYDDDCDGAVDEGFPPMYRDRDGDGDGEAGCVSTAMGRCPGAPGWSINSGDCDDTRSALHDGTSECDPAGSGVRICVAGAWVAERCPPGTSCRPQPGGTGICL